MSKNTIIKALTVILVLMSATFFVAMKGQKHENKVMVSISYSESPEKAYADLIPQEKEKFKALRKSGVIIDGYVTPDHTKGWMVLKVNNVQDAEKFVKQLPLYKVMKVEYTVLAPFSRYWHL